MSMTIQFEVSKSEIVSRLAVHLIPLALEASAAGILIQDFERGLFGGLLAVGGKVMDAFLEAQGNGDQGHIVAHEGQTLHRAGTLASTDELAGKRVTVQIDGGRTKLRGPLRTSAVRQEPRNEDGLIISDAPGRSKPRPKQTFDAEWREPKLMTIFIHNERGRIEKKTKMTIDGTFAGPDAMAELVAMHLHRLGAAKAVSLTFVSDGAVWIWDRIDQIVAWPAFPSRSQFIRFSTRAMPCIMSPWRWPPWA